MMMRSKMRGRTGANEVECKIELPLAAVRRIMALSVAHGLEAGDVVRVAVDLLWVAMAPVSVRTGLARVAKDRMRRGARTVAPVGSSVRVAVDNLERAKK